MNDGIKGDKIDPNGSHAHKPAWWTDSLETSWNKVKAEAIHDWDKLVDGEEKLEHSIDHEAIAFGYGARQAFHEFQAWSRHLEDRLQADWKETGHDANRAWDKVSGAAKHGWERASGPGKPPASSTP